MKSGNSAAATWLSHSNLALSGLLVFTLVVRGSVLWGMRGNLTQDPDAYREIAENLLVHGKFAMGKPWPYYGISWPKPTAYRPPLYPVVLSNLSAADGHHVSLLKVAVLHLLLGVAIVWLTWLTSAKYLVCMVGPASAARAGPPSSNAIGGPAAAWAALSHPTLAPFLAGLLVACDPILLNQQTLVMTETLAAFLAILSLWCLARFDAERSWFNAALAGGAIGLAILCRPTFLPWLGLVALTMLFVRGRKLDSRSQRSPKRLWIIEFGWRLANVASLLILVVAITSPWAIRNYRVFGKPILTTTHGGYTLVLANNDSFYAHLSHPMISLPWKPSPLFWLGPSDDPFASPDGELALDKWHYKLAWQAIAKNKSVFLYSCIYRLGQLWTPLPHKLTADESAARRGLRHATAAWYCGVYTLAAIGIWRLRWRLLQPPWIWGVLLCLVFTAVHTFYWTNLRMRAPLMPFVAIVAAAAIGSKFKVQSTTGSLC